MLKARKIIDNSSNFPLVKEIPELKTVGIVKILPIAIPKISAIITLLKAEGVYSASNNDRIPIATEKTIPFPSLFILSFKDS